MEGKALEKKTLEAQEEKSSKIAEQLPNNTDTISSATLSIEESPSKLDDNTKSDTLEKKDFKEAPEEKSFKIAEKNEQLPNNIDVPATSSGNSPKAVESDNKNSQSKLDGTTEGQTVEGEKNGEEKSSKLPEKDEKSTVNTMQKHPGRLQKIEKKILHSTKYFVVAFFVEILVIVSALLPVGNQDC